MINMANLLGINLNCLHGGRPRILNTKMEWSCLLQVARRRVSTILNVARHVKKDFGILLGV